MRQPLGHAELLQHLQCVGVNHRGARRVLACGELVNDHRGDAGAHEHRGQSKAGGTRADNQDIGIQSVCRDDRTRSL